MAEKSLEAALRELDKLIELEPINRAQRGPWYEAARDFERKLKSDYRSLSERLPQAIQHYLADADIRIDDPRYRERQISELRTAIASVREQSG